MENPQAWADPLGLSPCPGPQAKRQQIEGQEQGARWTNDLSHVTGSTAQSRNRALAAILKEDFPHLNFTHTPQYSPFVGHAVASHGQGTQIGPSPFASRSELRTSLIHEELHHRWWSRGEFQSHHPRDGSGTSEKFYSTVDRYLRMRGWN
ncbi:hypothetical protein ABZ702_00040 [Streptomyces cyaneofuscatus]